MAWAVIRKAAGRMYLNSNLQAEWEEARCEGGTFKKKKIPCT